MFHVNQSIFIITMDTKKDIFPFGNPIADKPAEVKAIAKKSAIALYPKKVEIADIKE